MLQFLRTVKGIIVSYKVAKANFNRYREVLRSSIKKNQNVPL